jgi:hypothetical protein
MRLTAIIAPPSRSRISKTPSTTSLALKVTAVIRQACWLGRRSADRSNGRRSCHLRPCASRQLRLAAWVEDLRLARGFTPGAEDENDMVASNLGSVEAFRQLAASGADRWFAGGCGGKNEASWQIDLDGGATRTDVDLRGGQLSGIAFNAGSSLVTLALPRPHGSVPVQMIGGARLADHGDRPVQLTTLSIARTVQVEVAKRLARLACRMPS